MESDAGHHPRVALDISFEFALRDGANASLEKLGSIDLFMEHEPAQRNTADTERRLNPAKSAVEGVETFAARVP